ncbi:MAG: hypothetical protein PHW69_06545 [Elusimicrobiaceae bacterium]|nr:hypothetical protein [Elusimicrobiaceae bacterium]
MNRKGLCLAEFLIALGLLAGMAITASAVSMYVANTSAKIDKSIMPITEANLAAEAVVQRVKRAAKYSGSDYFAVSSDNRTVLYKNSRGTVTEEFSFVGDQLRYRPDTTSSAYDVVLNGVDNLKFIQDGKRLSVQITMQSAAASTAGAKPSVCTGVFPVNTTSSRGTIN